MSVGKVKAAKPTETVVDVKATQPVEVVATVSETLKGKAPAKPVKEVEPSVGLILPADANVSGDLLGGVIEAALKAPKVKLGTLTIGGVLLTPTKENIKITHNSSLDEIKDTGRLPWGVVGNSVGKSFNYYEVASSDGTPARYLICEDSAVEMRLVDNSPYPRHSNTTSKNLLVLVNSKSIGDAFIGVNSLINVETKNCFFNSSDIKSTIDDKNRSNNLPWYRHPVVGQLFNETRRVYEGLNLKKCSVVNTGLSKGTYIGLSAYDSEIHANEWVTAKNVEINNSNVRGSNVWLKSVSFYEMKIDAERNVTIASGRYNRETLRDKQIYLQNRFDYLKITSLQGEIGFTRSNENEFELGLGYYNSKTFNLDVERTKIEEHVRKLVADVVPTFGGENTTPKTDPVSQSIIDYTTDTICSRLNVINMMRSVKNLAGFMNQDFDEFDDVHVL